MPSGIPPACADKSTQRRESGTASRNDAAKLATCSRGPIRYAGACLEDRLLVGVGEAAVSDGEPVIGNLEWTGIDYAYVADVAANFAAYLGFGGHQNSKHCEP